MYGGLRAIELVLEQDADEHGHADIVVIQEGSEAALTVAAANQPKLINEEYRRGEQAGVVPPAGTNGSPDKVQRYQGHGLEHRNDVSVRIAEQDGGGTHADL